MSISTERARSAPWRAVRRIIVSAARAHAIYFAIVGIYVAVALVLSATFELRHGGAIGQMPLAFVTFLLPTLLLALLALRFLKMVAYSRPARPTLALARDMREVLTHPARAANGLIMILVMFAFIRTFSYLKDNIPFIVPFAWDVSFMEMDLFLHFGYQPWELMQPVLGFAPITFAINVAYNLWFMLMWMMWVGFAFMAVPNALRTRFFVAFMLIWSVGGSLAAILLSSAGPAFYGNLGLDANPYVPLMTYLHEVNEWLPLWALTTQEVLWAGYEGRQDIILGISAMPSMHNASALLFALVGWKLDRRLGIGLSIYAFIIFLGSVHLGWHYAVDAYLAFAIVLPIWWVSGHIANWYERRAWTRSHARLSAACGD